MIIQTPICAGCIHFRGMQPLPGAQPGDDNHSVCDAYPQGIPDAIWLSRADHRRPYAGDGGVVFAPKDADAAEYANLLFTVLPARGTSATDNEGAPTA